MKAEFLICAEKSELGLYPVILCFVICEIKYTVSVN